MNPLLLSSLFDIGKGLIDRFFPDPAAAQAAKLELFKMQQSGELAALAASTDLAKAQIGVNAAEAASGNSYTASWRPTIGYVCTAALAFTYVVNPLLMWGVNLFHLNVPIPAIGIDEHLWELMTGMLGLAGWRTLDKIKGSS